MKSSSTSSPQLTPELVPPLTSDAHKGSYGRIGVLGGSKRFTGAPYYVAMSSLRVGSDLVFIFCAEEANVPLKSYSPELMVASVYCGKEFDKAISNEEENGRNALESDACSALVKKMVDEITPLFEKMHALVIGSGLGRCPLVLQATAKIIREARKCKLPLVLDADALYLLTLPQYRNLLTSTTTTEKSDNAEDSVVDVKKKSVVVLTPNPVEYERLVESLGDGSEEKFHRLMEGFVIVKKGHQDVVMCYCSASKKGGSLSNSKLTKMVCEEEGGLKRSGGIGDILAGTLGTFVAWNTILSESNKDTDLTRSCWAACCVVKRATRRAFDQKKRSMGAPDVIEHLGNIVHEMSSDTVKGS